MPYKQNVGNGVSAAKDTATEADVRHPKTFHAGKGTKARIGGILDCTIMNIIPGTKKQVVKRGVYLDEDLEIDGDMNLVSRNIRKGVSIFGTAGDENVVDTSGGNLESKKMLKGAVGYSRGQSVNGEIETLSDTSFSPSDSTAYNDSKITGSAYNGFVGAFDYSVLGYIAGKIRIHIANLIPSNIRSGAKVGGIGGYILGTFTGNATATKAYILKGKTAGVKGEMVTGEMENIGAIDPAKSVALSGGVLYARMSKGAHLNIATSGYPEVSIPQATVASAVEATSGKIIKGQEILGVRGGAYRSALVGYLAYDGNINYTGYSGTAGNRAINIGAPYGEWDTVIMQICSVTEFRGPVTIALSKGKDMRVPVTTLKWNDNIYRNAWLSVARSSNGTITLSPFRGNEYGTYRTQVTILAVLDGIINNES